MHWNQKLQKKNQQSNDNRRIRFFNFFQARGTLAGGLFVGIIFFETTKYPKIWYKEKYFYIHCNSTREQMLWLVSDLKPEETISYWCFKLQCTGRFYQSKNKYTKALSWFCKNMVLEYKLKKDLKWTWSSFNTFLTIVTCYIGKCAKRMYLLHWAVVTPFSNVTV